MVDPEGSRTLVSALLPPGVGHASGISGISMQDYNQLLLIWLYFQTVVAWAKAIFTDYTKFMKGLDWGILYNKYHNNTYDPVKFASEVKRLIADKDVTKNSGIYEYLLSGDEKFLQIRAFDDDQKMEDVQNVENILSLMKCKVIILLLGLSVERRFQKIVKCYVLIAIEEKVMLKIIL